MRPSRPTSLPTNPPRSPPSPRPRNPPTPEPRATGASTARTRPGAHHRQAGRLHVFGPVQPGADFQILDPLFDPDPQPDRAPGIALAWIDPFAGHHPPVVGHRPHPGPLAE